MIVDTASDWLIANLITVKVRKTFGTVQTGFLVIVFFSFSQTFSANSARTFVLFSLLS